MKDVVMTHIPFSLNKVVICRMIGIMWKISNLGPLGIARVLGDFACSHNQNYAVGLNPS